MRRRLIYRPPFEAETFLLEVTEGCTWNKCTFCSMYKTQSFRVLPEEDIREQLEVFREQNPAAGRIFLENGDAYALGTDRLLAIADLIREYLPDIGIITGYASIRNIMHKTLTGTCAFSGKRALPSRTSDWRAALTRPLRFSARAIPPRRHRNSFCG